MNRSVFLLLRIVAAWGLILLITPQLPAQEFGVVEDLYVGRHTISPFGGLGRYQQLSAGELLKEALSRHDAEGPVRVSREEMAT